MKKVIIKKKETRPIYESLNDLMNTNSFVGFKAPGSYKIYHRYMIITGGSGRGLAVNPISTWAKVEYQGDFKEHYYVFDTDKELYAWLLGEEDE